MRAGALRHRITVQRSSTVKNDRGGTVNVVLTVLEDVPASITVKRGNETVQAQRLSGITPYDIVIRYTPDSAKIVAGDFLTDQDGQRYSIKWVGCLDVGRPRALTIMAETGTVAGR